MSRHNGNKQPPSKRRIAIPKSMRGSQITGSRPLGGNTTTKGQKARG